MWLWAGPPCSWGIWVRAPYTEKKEIVQQRKLKSGMVPGTKTNWPTDHRSQYNLKCAVSIPWNNNYSVLSVFLGTTITVCCQYSLEQQLPCAVSIPWNNNYSVLSVFLGTTITMCCQFLLEQKSKWKSHYNRQSVGQSVLVSGTHLGPSTNFSFSLKFSLDSCRFVIL
jgi:hypothetical protein